MGRLPAAMPKTISAADYLRRSACPPDAHRQAGDLLLALAAVECHVSVGGPAGVPPALLRDLVIITGRLAGRAWLDANADSMAAFSALLTTRQPPPLPELDHVLAGVLSGRFGPAAAAVGSFNPADPRLRDRGRGHRRAAARPFGRDGSLARGETANRVAAMGDLRAKP